MIEPRVTVILLNYSRWQDTVDCVHSLKCCRYKNFKILVVDNGSPDDSEARLRDCLPDVEILQTGKNLGYTGGVNFGIRQTLRDGPDYILVLNPDTLVEPSFLNLLVAGMESNPSVAAACGTIYYHPDTLKVWYAGGHLIPWRGLAIHRRSVPIAKDGTLGGAQRVTFVTGCMVLLRTSVIDTVGIQDERFFLYLDDIEYSARILKKGFHLVYVPEAVIFHRIRTENDSELKLYYSVRNRMLLIDTAFSLIPKSIAKVYFLLVISGKLLFWWILKPRLYRAARMGLEDYFSRRLYEGRGISEFLHEER